MKKIPKILGTLSLVTMMLLNTGCGDSSSTDTTNTITDTTTDTVLSSPYITGTVAVGAALVAEVTLIDEAGVQRQTNSDEDGHYSILREGLTETFVLRAQTPDATLYSYSDGTSTTVNVTPLTTVVVNNIAESNGATGGASELFVNYDEYNDLHSEVDALSDEVDRLNALLDELITTLGLTDSDGEVVDHFGYEFETDNTGYDELLDVLDIEYSGDDVVIRVDDTTVIDTVDYNLTSDALLDISGKIVDASTGAALEGALLTFENHNTSETTTTTTDDSGYFSISVENFRVYDIEITLNGYVTGVYENVDTFMLSSISTQTIPLLPDTITGLGTVDGEVLDGRTSDTTIAGVTLEFREGINNLDGEIVASAMTNIQGEYSVLLQSGIYTVTYSLDGFTTVSEVVSVVAGETLTYNTSIIGAVDLLDADAPAATIVLSWNENPSDLDTHFTGPNIDNTDRFHIAYYDQVYSDSSLDLSEYKMWAYEELYYYAAYYYISSTDFNNIVAEIEAVQTWSYEEYDAIYTAIDDSVDYSIYVEDNYQYEFLNDLYYDYDEMTTVEFEELLALAETIVDETSYEAAYDAMDSIVYGSYEDYTYEYNYVAALMGDLYYNYAWGYLTQTQFEDLSAQIEAGAWDEYSYYTMSNTIYESSDYSVYTDEPNYYYQYLGELAMNYGWNAMDEDTYNTYVDQAYTVTDYDTYISMIDAMYYAMYEESDTYTTVISSNPCENTATVASIDRDDTDSYGPETTTLCKVQDDALYSYYVHHYSGSSTMSDSPAEVTVTTAAGSRTFIAPSGAEGTDEIWHVFNMDGNGNVYPINTYLSSATDSETLYAPSRISTVSKVSTDTRFSSETGLVNNLPAK